MAAATHTCSYLLSKKIKIIKIIKGGKFKFFKKKWGLEIQTKIIIYFGTPNRSMTQLSKYTYRPSLCLQTNTMPMNSHTHMLTYYCDSFPNSGNYLH